MREFAGAARRWSAPEKRGGKGPVRLMFTSWSPPAALKSNRLVSGRSNGTDRGLGNRTLRQDLDGRGYAYDEFADWWLTSLRRFKDLVGAYPDYIALQNEPEIAVTYEGCQFLPTEGTSPEGFAFAGYDRALTAVSDRLHGALGDQSPHIVGPETFTIRLDPDHRSHVARFVDPTADTGKAELGRLFGVSFHLYGSCAESADPTQFHAALSALRDAYHAGDTGSKPLFENEFLEGPTLTSVAGMIHDTLAIGGASAYLVWIAARGVTQPGYALVYYNAYDGSVERRER